MYWRVLIASVLTAGVVLLPSRGVGEESPSKSLSQPTYVLRTSVMGAAGAPSEAGGVHQKGTLAQPTPTGISAASGIQLSAGYWEAWMETVTGVEETPAYADRLFQNYPNPFNPTTTIEYTVAKTSTVTITIYNVKGQRVRQLVDESRPPGKHTAKWDGTTDRGDVVASGVYFYRIRIGGFTDVKKMVVLK